MPKTEAFSSLTFLPSHTVVTLAWSLDVRIMPTLKAWDRASMGVKLNALSLAKAAKSVGSSTDSIPEKAWQSIMQRDC